MYEWHQAIQAVVETIDRGIQNQTDAELTLAAIAKRLRYSPFHASRKFHALAGMPLRDYLRQRRLAFALIDLRDSQKPILEIAVAYGFASHAAFTRAFKAAYGITPQQYRQKPRPLVLRTKITTFDRYLLGIGEIGMLKSAGNIKIYFVKIPAHKLLHIKNYHSDGYFDFWAKQAQIPVQDCDTICGLLDSIKGKLDGDDSAIGVFSGQCMAHINEPGGQRPEAYGVRLASDYAGPVPGQMLMLDVAEGEYLVFEHGPFDYEQESETVGERLAAAVEAFSYEHSGYQPDPTPGRVAYFYHEPDKFEKIIQPVKKC